MSKQPGDRAANPSPAMSVSLLNAIRSNDEQAKQAALQQMYDLLNVHAMKKLGRREGRGEMQATSIVQSVLVREVAAGDLNRFNDDQHLEARLKQAVNNKIFDRHKKKRPNALPVDDDGRQFDPAAAGPGVGTQIMNAEELAGAAEKMSHFRDTCMAAPISGTQRTIVDLVLFKEASWEEVAEQCGTTVSAAKARMSEARRKVVTHLLKPLRQQCDGATWQVIETTLIDRRSIDTAAKRSGVDLDAAKRVLSEMVWPEIAKSYGQESWETFKRLLGNRRSKSSEQ